MDCSIRAFRGDTLAIPIRFKEEDGSPIDITGWTVFLTVKERQADPDADALIAKTVTSHGSPADGLTAVGAAASETNGLQGDYRYDIQFRKADGTIGTVARGTIRFEADITRRTS